MINSIRSYVFPLFIRALNLIVFQASWFFKINDIGQRSELTYVRKNVCLLQVSTAIGTDWRILLF